MHNSEGYNWLDNLFETGPLQQTKITQGCQCIARQLFTCRGTPPCNLWVNRLRLIEKTLDISTNKPAFAFPPMGENHILNDIVKQIVLPSRMQEQNRLQF